MKIYDTSKGLADVTLENLAEFVDWWLFWRAYDALHKVHRHPNFVDDLQKAIEETLRAQNAPLELVPVVLAKAEHIQSLLADDTDLFEFIHAPSYDAVPASNPYKVRYADDRYLASWGAQRLSELPSAPGFPSADDLRIDGDDDAVYIVGGEDDS